MLSERKKLSTDVQKHPGRADGNLGDQSEQRRDPDRRAHGKHGPCDWPSRPRRNAIGRQDHPCGGGVPGVADPYRRRQGAVEHSGGHAASLSANADRDRLGTEFHDRVPDADRYRQTVPELLENAGKTPRANGALHMPVMEDARGCYDNATATRFATEQ